VNPGLYELAKEYMMWMKKNIFRKELCLFLALTLFLAVTGFSQEEDLKVRVVVRRANIREKPSLSSEVVAQVKRGRILQVDSKEGEWYLIRLPLKLEGYALPGYIHQSIVEVVGAKPPALAKKARIRKSAGETLKYGIGGALGSSFPSRRAYNSGLDFSGFFSYKFSEKITVELAARFFSSGVEGDPQGLSQGSLSVFPFQLSVQYRIPIDGQTIAYLAGGMGYYLNGFSVSDTSFDRVEKVKNALGFHLGGGIEYFFKGNLAVKVDLKYCFIKTSGSWSYTDPITGPVFGTIDNINLNTVLIAIGIKYIF
ncbi:MAG: outer membrane beta-barrel protein, partial [Candidatus Aminicenantes bacterium]|nr:outer membrane beta-barrel protein [Candidatus Aminicenantes bacterium]